MLDVLYWFSKARSESTLAFRGESELQRSNFGSGFGGKQRTHKAECCISMYAMVRKKVLLKKGEARWGTSPKG